MDGKLVRYWRKLGSFMSSGVSWSEMGFNGTEFIGNRERTLLFKAQT
jgi:hypothetical protein